jgi:hypothetical protein
MAFVIEKDVPMVSNRRGRRPTEFPLVEMEVADSFLISIEPGEDAEKTVESWRRKLRNAIVRFQEEYTDAEGIKFTTAITEGGLRVYRTQ